MLVIGVHDDAAAPFGQRRAANRRGRLLLLPGAGEFHITGLIHIRIVNVKAEGIASGG